MNVRSVRRAGALASVFALVVTGTALADTIVPDADSITGGYQSAVDLGLVLPGSTHVVNVPIALVCEGSSHVAGGQTITVIGSAIGPADVSATSIDVPSSWASCTPGQRLEATAPSVVTITAPTAAGLSSVTVDYFTSFSVVEVDVAMTVDTPPTLGLPSSNVTVEGNTTGGAFASYVVTAADAEDTTAPTPLCSRASGTFFPLGTTIVTCTATDSAGMTTEGSFEVDVVDTTPPVLVGMPGAASATTRDPSGTAARYDAPTVTDLVDPAPTVSCLPASGSIFPVGTTTVTCTATDASGNSTEGGFDVQVTLAAIEAPVATWAPPVASGVVLLRSDRTLPVKVALTDGDQAMTQGDVELGLTPLSTCPVGAANVATTPAAGPRVAAGRLTWQQGVNRWSMLLAASTVPGTAGSCARADLTVDGVEAGFFVLRVVR